MYSWKVEKAVWVKFDLILTCFEFSKKFSVVNRKKIVKMWKLKITEDYYFGEMKKYYKYIFCCFKVTVFFICTCVLISSAPVGQIFISTLRDKAADISFLMPPSKLKSFQGDRSYRVNSLRSRIAKTAKFSGFSYFVTFQRFYWLERKLRAYRMVYQKKSWNKSYSYYNFVFLLL